MNRKILLLILLVGIFLRSYHPLQWFMYGHDQDLLGWVIRDVVVSHHLRLIGQETSSHGVFIGPLFYYLQIPFYFLTGMDPKGGLLLSIAIGAFSIFSIYFVFKRVFNEKVGLIGALIYSLSYVIIFTDREVVPTQPVMLWSIWFFYAIYKLLKRDKWGFVLSGFLFGLIWSLNLALMLLAPLVLVAIILSKKINFKFALIGIVICVFMNIPFLVFEKRHDFQQTRAIISSLTTSKDYVKGTSTGLAKMDRVLQLVHRNTTRIYWDSVFNVPVALTFYALIAIFLVLVYKKIIPRNIAIVMLIWQVLYVIFFTVNSINISEYYLNGMNVIWICLLALGMACLIDSKYKKFGILVIAVFMAFNLYAFLSKLTDDSGYLERKAIVHYINEDAKSRQYPCVSISYITSPGNDLGYRYFIWRENLKTKPVISNAPVYTIAFPHSKVERIDKSFGALGLVLPDYARYTKDGVEKSCSGEDSNLTDPMFGFTK